MKQEMKATKPFRGLKVGDKFTVSGPQSRVLRAVGLAEPIEIDPLDHDEDGRKGGSRKGSASTRTKGKAKRGEYQRRDMRAAD